jgi:hypothetical protein
MHLQARPGNSAPACCQAAPSSTQVCLQMRTVLEIAPTRPLLQPRDAACHETDSGNWMKAEIRKRLKDVDCKYIGEGVLAAENAPAPFNSTVSCSNRHPLQHVTLVMLLSCHPPPVAPCRPVLPHPLHPRHIRRPRAVQDGGARRGARGFCGVRPQMAERLLAGLHSSA